jgi:endonuclease/exonuclease/phosphatase family metal-dependent hydrolase
VDAETQPNAVLLSALSWNLFHGRDFPPDRSLFTLRARLLGVGEDNGAYVQLNRALEHEYAAMIARQPWSVCLLQEVPPGWAATLARASGAWAYRTLTSRNQLRPLTRIAGRRNPDLIASWEGGSNAILVRGPWRPLSGTRRSLLLNPLPGRRLRERRRMSFVRLRHSSGAELCVANLHASGGASRAEHDVRRAAEAAVSWSAGAPLLLGGDLNLRPRATRLYDELERRFGLGGATVPDAIDHLLASGLETVSAASEWAAERRELELRTRSGPRKLRLSDHAPVEAVFRTGIR